MSALERFRDELIVQGKVTATATQTIVGSNRARQADR